VVVGTGTEEAEKAVGIFCGARAEEIEQLGLGQRSRQWQGPSQAEVGRDGGEQFIDGGAADAGEHGLALGV
jgi:hypothetical protein